MAAVIETGTPGAWARREFERRRTRREERIRDKHRRLGGLIHGLSDEPQSTRAWDTGALGEERLGKRFNELASDRLLVLHDRRIPGTRANIDHLAITSTGVYVIDAKRYAGRPHLRVEGGLFRPRLEKLIVGTFTTGGVEVLWPKKLYPKLRADEPVEIETITQRHRVLASALPPA